MIGVKGYWKPGTINEALDILAEKNAKVLAGGTDLVLDLGRKEIPADIVDVGAIPDLKQIREDEDQVYIGSGVTFTQAQMSPIINRYCSALAEAASVVGSPQIRNQGTIGGNIANASPAADTVPAMVAMDAQAVLASARGRRLVKLTDLLKGINKIDLAPDEMIIEIVFRKISNFQSTFVKLGRRNALAISRISSAVGVSLDDKQMIREARVALGSVAPNPFRSSMIESALLGKKATEEIIEEVLDAARNDVAERLGPRASAPYKREAIRGVVRKALETLFS